MDINIYNSDCPVFQVDSDIVKSAYNKLDNYLIETDENCGCTNEIPTCVLYFSGHSIYFPNDESTFNREILRKNRSEWFGLRIKDAKKHIFLRDIHKQWYLSGINANINSPDKLFEFLRKETDGYKVICIGSSAGGYAAILYGSMLGAKCVYAFSPRLEMKSLDTKSNEEKCPIYFRVRNTERERYMKLHPFIMSSNVPIYCFYPVNSNLDKIQLDYIETLKIDKEENFHIIKFDTSKHGVPFPKVALSQVLNKELILHKYESKINNPFIFSIHMVGLVKTIRGMIEQVKKKLFR